MDTPHTHPRGIPIRRSSGEDVIATHHIVSEHTPLLQPVPPIPRIRETADENDHLAAPEHIPTTQMFREELLILTRYSLPVFGYAHSFNPPVAILTPFSLP
jgi:MATE family multidrug resistance protein